MNKKHYSSSEYSQKLRLLNQQTENKSYYKSLNNSDKLLFNNLRIVFDKNYEETIPIFKKYLVIRQSVSDTKFSKDEGINTNYYDDSKANYTQQQALDVIRWINDEISGFYGGVPEYSSHYPNDISSAEYRSMLGITDEDEERIEKRTYKQAVKDLRKFFVPVKNTKYSRYIDLRTGENISKYERSKRIGKTKK